VAKTKATKPKGKAKPKSPLPKKASKKSTAPSIPLPPPAPLPPAPRDEMIAPRDVARLTRYGERFGAQRIDVRMLPSPLPVASGTLAVFDPSVPKTWRVFDRPVGTGQFRTMLSVARDEAGKERLAAIVVHVGRPPIAKWTVAHYQGAKKPKSVDVLPRCAVTSGWIALLDGGDPPGAVAVPEQGGVAPVEIPLTDGRKLLALACGNGEFAAYWAVDAADKPICLVIDFDRFTQKEWKARPTSP
jgi:hypothetical protein